MELELQKERFECYRPGAVLASTSEESAETIVPDYCPDIARIVNVSACLLLRSRTAADGKLAAEGSVRLTLLYLAEESRGLRAMEYSVPVELNEKLPESCEDVSIEGRVCAVEVRTLNPRKLFTRLTVEWKATPYCRTTLTTCGEIAQREQYAIQTLCEQRDISLIRAVSCKDFVFTDEITLPGGQDAIAELLCTRVRLRVTEVKSIGSKAILKGIACVSLLYAGVNGKLCSYAEELPFSQILDGAAQDEGGETGASAVLNLSGCEIHTVGEGGDGRGVDVKLFLSAFVVMRSTQSVCCITDLYSTEYDLDAQMEEAVLWQKPETESVIQSVREQLDTGTEAKCVLGADVCFGDASIRRESDRAVLHAAANISVLYLDESDAPFSLERRVDVTAEAHVSGDASVSVEEVCAGDISANINANGIELRFPAEFRLVTASSPSCACLMALRAEEREDTDDAPSLVLRAPREDETLWDIAKQYRTTVEEILSANELTESSTIELGQMLLIPRKR